MQRIMSKYCLYEKKCLEVVASNNSCLNVVSDLWKRNLECHKWLQTELTEFQLHKNACFNCHHQCSVCHNKRYWKFTREKYNEISRHESNESLWQRHVKEKHGSVNRMILYLSKLNDVVQYCHLRIMKSVFNQWQVTVTWLAFILILPITMS